MSAPPSVDERDGQARRERVAAGASAQPDGVSAAGGAAGGAHPHESRGSRSDLKAEPRFEPPPSWRAAWKSFLPLLEKELAANALVPFSPVCDDDTWIDGRYQVQRLLGEGGMGRAYLVANDQGQKLVAKTLRPDLSEQKEIQRRFWSEASALMRVHREHVVKIHDVGSCPNHGFFVVMDYIDGLDLQRLLVKHQRPLPHELVAWLVLQLGSALGAIHATKMVHRDIKPGNLMLQKGTDGGPHLTVIDFGVARLERKKDGTSTTIVAGTPGFMSYEQCAGWAVDHRSDIYALGQVAHILLFGTLFEPGMALTSNAFDSARFRTWIEKACALEKNARFNSAEEAAWALIAALGVEVPSPCDRDQPSAEAPGQTPCAKPSHSADQSESRQAESVPRDGSAGPGARSPRWPWPIVVIALLLAIGAGAAFVATRPRQISSEAPKPSSTRPLDPTRVAPVVSKIKPSDVTEPSPITAPPKRVAEVKRHTVYKKRERDSLDSGPTVAAAETAERSPRESVNAAAPAPDATLGHHSAKRNTPEPNAVESSALPPVVATPEPSPPPERPVAADAPVAPKRPPSGYY